MSQKILVLQRSAPYGNSLARDGLDYVLTAAAYDQDLSLLFMGDGVFQLLNNQQSQEIQLKPQDKALEVLPLYDVDKLYAIKEDLEERNLIVGNLAVELTLIARSQVSDLMSEQDKVIGF